MSALEHIEVCFLDDRDPVRQGQERWKVRPIRKNGKDYEIQINGVWCTAASWRGFSGDWEAKGYGETSYGTIHKDPSKTASSQYGKASRRVSGVESPFAIQACAVLGVHWPVDPDEVKRAYRRLAKEAHPDLGGDKERFQEIQDAYEALKQMVEVAA